MERIAVADFKNKLERYHLRLDNPAGRNYTYEFADFLSERFGDRPILPEEFLLAIELAFDELRKGIDGITGEPIRHNAVDGVPTVELFVRMDLPAIIDAIFPPEFATEVKRVQAEVQAEMEKDGHGKKTVSKKKSVKKKRL